MATTTIIRTALFSLAVGALATGCSRSSSTTTAEADTSSTSTTTTTPQRPDHLVDELVTTAHGRMHLHCDGDGQATVLLLAGWDDAGNQWGSIEPALTPHARVCSYSRFGLGTSDAPTDTQTFESQAADLDALLAASGERGPYIVVGHSFGGAAGVTFAYAHPDSVLGLVLIDASPVTWPDTACSVPEYADLCAVMHDPERDPERLDVFSSFRDVAQITSLGDLPMIVMTAEHRVDPGLSPERLAELDDAWNRGVGRWASLSTDSTTVHVPNTGHNIHVDQPDAVIAAITRLLP